MKSILFIISVLLISSGLFAQNGLDYMGIPTEQNSQLVNEYIPVKNTNAVVIPILKQFVSPTSMPTSITYHDGLLWVTGYNDYVVYKVSTITGNVVGTFPVSIQKPYGITFKNDNVFILDNISKNIFEYTETGTLLDSINLANVASHVYPTGLCYTGNEFWYNDTKGPNPSAANDSTYSFSQQLLLNNSFEAAGAFPTGIAYDGNHIWINDNPSQATNMMDPITHTVLKSFKTPGGAYPNGIAYDGEGLWIINNSSDSIYFMIPEGITNINSEKQLTNGINIYSFGSQIIFNYNEIWKGSDFVIYDLTSKEIYKNKISGDNSFILNQLNFNEGIYIVSVINKENIYSEKILLSR